MKVFRSMILDAPIERSWAAVRAFDGVVNWNPGVSGARLESGHPTEVGAIRHLDIADGTAFRETLLAHSEIDHFYTYDILESPLPVTGYISTHSFTAITATNQTLGIWQSEFECASGDASEMDRVVGDVIYVGGMIGLNDYLKGT